MLDATGKELELRDLEAKHVVGVQIGELGHKLWVCVDGVAVLRVNAPRIELTDHRIMTDAEPEANIAEQVGQFRSGALVHRKGDGPEQFPEIQ